MDLVKSSFSARTPHLAPRLSWRKCHGCQINKKSFENFNQINWLFVASSKCDLSKSQTTMKLTWNLLEHTALHTVVAGVKDNTPQTEQNNSDQCQSSKIWILLLFPYFDDWSADKTSNNRRAVVFRISHEKGLQIQYHKMKCYTKNTILDACHIEG